jgi:pimeloyl-ACP methyl ester carboxylesterase
MKVQSGFLGSYPSFGIRADAEDRSLNTIRNPATHVRLACRARLAVLLTLAAFMALGPKGTMAENVPGLTVDTPTIPGESAVGCSTTMDGSRPDAPCQRREPLIVIGFMGGHIRAGNLAHGEARLASDLDRRYPAAVDAMTFANRHAGDALRTVLRLLDTSKDGRLSEAEKRAARIVLFGHSWGASEAIHFAQELDRHGIPVLLTIQVDSVEKSGEDDGSIPPNVREAINFYQAEGLLHGRSSIQAIDPKRTKILGSYESKYKKSPVSCAGYSWFARAFMRPHIEIENDGAVWDRIEALIVARASEANPAGMVTASAAK